MKYQLLLDFHKFYKPLPTLEQSAGAGLMIQFARYEGNALALAAFKGVPLMTCEDPYMHGLVFDRARELFEEYELAYDRLERFEFFALCRRWRKEFGKSWKSLYREGYASGKASLWTNILITNWGEREADPREYGYAMGHNTLVLERR